MMTKTAHRISNGIIRSQIKT